MTDETEAFEAPADLELLKRPANRTKDTVPCLTIRRDLKVAFNRSAVRQYGLGKFHRVQVQYSHSKQMLVFSFLDANPRHDPASGIYRVRWCNPKDRVDMVIELGAMVELLGLNPRKALLRCPVRQDQEQAERFAALVGEAVDVDHGPAGGLTIPFAKVRKHDQS